MDVLNCLFFFNLSTHIKFSKIIYNINVIKCIIFIIRSSIIVEITLKQSFCFKKFYIGNNCLPRIHIHSFLLKVSEALSWTLEIDQWTEQMRSLYSFQWREKEKYTIGSEKSVRGHTPREGDLGVPCRAGQGREAQG